MVAVKPAATEGASVPPPAADIDAFTAEVDEAVTELRDAVDKAGLRRDAYGAVIAAQARVLGLMPGFLRRMDAIADRGQGIDPASLKRLEQGAVTGASRYAAQLATAHTWRTALIAGGIYVASLLTAIVVADRWGHAAERAAFQETEDQLRAAFAAGPASASAWALLMQNNDAAAALSHCRGSEMWRDPNTGRRVCRLLVYVEPPRQDAAR